MSIGKNNLSSRLTTLTHIATKKL